MLKISSQHLNEWKIIVCSSDICQILQSQNQTDFNISCKLSDSSTRFIFLRAQSSQVAGQLMSLIQPHNEVLGNKCNFTLIFYCRKDFTIDDLSQVDQMKKQIVFLTYYTRKFLILKISDFNKITKSVAL